MINDFAADELSPIVTPSIVLLQDLNKVRANNRENIKHLPDA